MTLPMHGELSWRNSAGRRLSQGFRPPRRSDDHRLRAALTSSSVRHRPGGASRARRDRWSAPRSPRLAKRRTSADPTMPRWPATQTRCPSSRNCEVGCNIALFRPLHRDEIGIDHLGDEPGKVGPVLPAELLSRLRGVAQKEVDFGRTEVPRVDFHEDLSLLRRRLARRRPSRAIPDRRPTSAKAASTNSAPTRFRRSPAHSRRAPVAAASATFPIDILACVAPIALRIEVSEIQLILAPRWIAAAARVIFRSRRFRRAAGSRD